MNKISKKIICMFLLGTGLQSAAIAEESKSWSVDTSAAFYSEYMFRGFKLSDHTTIQPSVTGNYITDVGTFSGNLWMHIPAESGSADTKFTELDETIKYAYAFDDVTIAAGHVWYTYPDSDDDIASTAEFFASLAINSPLLNPVLSVYHDYQEFDTQYYELGLSHSFEECFEGSSATVSPFVAFGFGSNTEKVYADNGLEQVTFGASMSIPLGSLSFIPSVNYTAQVDDNTVNQFWFGSSLNYSF